MSYSDLGDARMEDREPRTYFATFRDLELQIRESNGRYIWTVTDSKTGSQTAQAEVAGLENAMVAAAQKAGADWGSIRWRSNQPED
jgi:hypothetical protein